MLTGIEKIIFLYSNFVKVRFTLFISFVFAILSSNSFANTELDSLFESRSANLILTKLTGDNQYARAGTPFQEPLKVQASNKQNKAVENVLLHISLVEPIGDTKNNSIFTDSIRTDSLGIALFSIHQIDDPGKYTFMISCGNKNTCPPLFLNVNARKSNWVFILIIGLFGGLGFFLLGMNMMSEGMQNSAGNRMRTILSKLTNNRFIAFGLGALVTMVIQSSSATNVMLVSFVNSKLMRFKQTIGIMLGAAIGTTITAQIIAFKLTDYALLFVVLGLMMQYLAPKQSVKEIGKALLGFGILFFGMHIMSESMYPLRTYDPFLEVIMNLQNPVIGILVGAIFTALIQSSSAFIGILIILSMQGLLTLNAAIPLLIGANVGTSITAILASLNGSRESKQVALAHTIFKIIGAVIVLVFFSGFTQLIINIADKSEINTSANGDMLAQARQIANAHTIYNIALCLLFIPFIGLFARFITWIFPSREEPEEPFRLRYIDESLLKAPVLALDSARLELVRMMKKVYYMTEKIIHPFIDRATGVLSEIERAEEEINYLRDNIVDYLLKITQNALAADTTEDAFIMMNAVREFEQIADVISHQLKEKAESWCESDFQFSEEGKEELIKYHADTLTIIVQALKVYENYDLKAARKLKALYQRYREEYFQMEQQHYARLKGGVESTHSSSKTHLEIITLLRVISSHATNTSRILIYNSNHRKTERSK